MTTAIKETDRATEAPASVASTGGFGLFVRWRHQIEAEADARYWLIFRRLGICVKRALDGTPWTHKGRRYLVSIADHSLRLALGKWVVAFSLRRPNADMSNERQNGETT